MHNQTNYTLCRLEQHQPVTCLQLPADLIHICYVSGRFFWLLQSGEMCWTDKQLQIQSAGFLSKEYCNIEQFHLSSDFRWFVALQTGEQHSIIYLWEFQEVTNHDTAN